MMESKLFLNGRKSVLELLKNEDLRALILNVYLSSSQKLLISQCKELDIPYSLKPKSWLGSLQKELKSKYNDVFATLNSREQLSFAELIEKLSKANDSHSELIVMLDKVHDPYNFGAIIRTCVAAGVNYLIYPSTNNVRLNNSVLKTSLGYALKLNLIAVSNLSIALQKLKDLGFWSYAASLTPDSKPYSTVNFSSKSLLILGNEGKGISPYLESQVDWKLTIPLCNNVDSLNVSVAAGILIYEWVKRREN